MPSVTLIKELMEIEFLYCNYDNYYYTIKKTGHKSNNGSFDISSDSIDNDDDDIIEPRKVVQINKNIFNNCLENMLDRIFREI